MKRPAIRHVFNAPRLQSLMHALAASACAGQVKAGLNNLNMLSCELKFDPRHLSVQKLDTND